MAGGATATIKGGFYEVNGITSLTQIAGNNALRRRAAMWLARKGAYANRQLMITLDGAAPGSTATKNLTRIEANVELGGVRVVETEALVNRVTTAQDVTDTKADILSLSTRTTFGASPPANLDGNPLGTR